MFAEIREVSSLEELSNSILGESKASKTTVSKSVPLAKTKDSIETIESIKSTSMSLKNTSSFVDISEKERKGDLFYRKGEEQAFTGVFALFMGDWVQYIETYKNGVLDGESSWHTEHGTRILYENYSNGKLQGKQLSYYENGSPKTEVLYDKGRIVGVTCFSKKGEILHKNHFENGTGLWKLYWENGNVLETGKYVNFRKDGVWKRYHEDGSLESTLEYSNGRLLKETWG